MTETPPILEPDAEAAWELFVLGIEDRLPPPNGTAESAAWFQAQLQELGFTEADFARFLVIRGDDRSRSSVERHLRRMASGQARVSGEMRVLLGMMVRARRRKMAEAVRKRKERDPAWHEARMRDEREAPWNDPPESRPALLQADERILSETVTAPRPASATLFSEASAALSATSEPFLSESRRPTAAAHEPLSSEALNGTRPASETRPPEVLAVWSPSTKTHPSRTGTAPYRASETFLSETSAAPLPINEALLSESRTAPSPAQGAFSSETGPFQTSEPQPSAGSTAPPANNGPFRPKVAGP